jgi:hypothetical protein
VGGLVALAGVALLIFGVVALGGGDGSSGAAPAPTTSSVAPSPTPSATPAPSATLEPTPSGGTGVGGTPSPTPARTTPAPAPAPTRPTTARAPLTVLNNSTIAGLADRAAGEAQSRGWQVAQVGNFAGRLPATTVYYTPGDAAGEAAARQLAREFPHVEQVLPRYAGLPPTPSGIVLVVTRTW